MIRRNDLAQDEQRARREKELAHKVARAACKERVMWACVLAVIIAVTAVVFEINRSMR